MAFQRRRRGFSLLEVVAAVGIFAIGIVAVIGLYAPVAKTVGASAEAEAANRAAEAVLSRLQAMPFTAVEALLKTPAEVQAQDALGNYNPNDTNDARAIFATQSGDVGILELERKVWLGADGTTVLQNRDKFFEITLVRDARLSTPSLHAFVVRVRWPVFQPGPGTTAVQIGAGQAGSVAYDHSRQQVAFFSGAVLR